MEWTFNYIAITNNVNNAKILDLAGIQQIMVDLEVIGKNKRQFGKNAIISDHKISDINKLKNLGLKSEIICRVNPFNINSEIEIENVISGGADKIMIPMIENIDDFNKTIEIINQRVKIIPLIETPYSIFKLPEIIKLGKVNQIHFGLNDLNIALGTKNLFEILLSPFFDDIIKKSVSITEITGFGGIANPLKEQKINPILILHKHLELGSRSVILSRSFFDNNYNLDEIKVSLNKFEKYIKNPNHNLFNKELLKKQIEES